MTVREVFGRQDRQPVVVVGRVEAVVVQVLFGRQPALLAKVVPALEPDRRPCDYRTRFNSQPNTPTNRSITSERKVRSPVKKSSSKIGVIPTRAAISANEY